MRRDTFFGRKDCKSCDGRKTLLGIKCRACSGTGEAPVQRNSQRPLEESTGPVNPQEMAKILVATVRRQPREITPVRIAPPRCETCDGNGVISGDLGNGMRGRAWCPDCQGTGHLEESRKPLTKSLGEAYLQAVAPKGFVPQRNEINIETGETYLSENEVFAQSKTFLNEVFPGVNTEVEQQKFDAAHDLHQDAKAILAVSVYPHIGVSAIKDGIVRSQRATDILRSSRLYGHLANHSDNTTRQLQDALHFKIDQRENDPESAWPRFVPTADEIEGYPAPRRRK